MAFWVFASDRIGSALYSYFVLTGKGEVPILIEDYMNTTVQFNVNISEEDLVLVVPASIVAIQDQLKIYI